MSVDFFILFLFFSFLFSSLSVFSFFSSFNFWFYVMCFDYQFPLPQCSSGKFQFQMVHLVYRAMKMGAFVTVWRIIIFKNRHWQRDISWKFNWKLVVFLYYCCLLASMSRYCPLINSCNIISSSYIFFPHIHLISRVYPSITLCNVFFFLNMKHLHSRKYSHLPKDREYERLRMEK